MLGGEHPVLLGVIGRDGIIAVVVELLLDAAAFLLLLALHALQLSQQVPCPLRKGLLGARVVVLGGGGGRVVDDSLQELLLLPQEGLVVTRGLLQSTVQRASRCLLRIPNYDFKDSIVAAKGKELHFSRTKRVQVQHEFTQ